MSKLDLLKESFNINQVIQSEMMEKGKELVIDKTTYDEAEKIVRDKIVNQRGVAAENEQFNEILAKAILGDDNSIRQLKEFIRQYLTDEKKFTKEQIEVMTHEIYTNNFGLSAIDDLVKDDSVNEIWVNGANHVWIEKGGLKTRLDRHFRNDEEVVRVMRQMLQFDRKEINSTKPVAESKLLDGSRLTFAIPPASSYPVMNIRKFKGFEVTEENVLYSRTIDRPMLDWFKLIIKGRANVLVIGETGSGKTSFLKFLCDYIDPKLRVGTVESNLELKLTDKYPDRNIFEYESHEEIGVDLGMLFRLCLRSSPDIIILGEARGSEESEALINSMRRGHPGSIGTIHTNSADTAIDDLMEMIMEDGKKREPPLLKHRIANAIEFIVQAHRYEDGKRRIVRVTEVIPILDEDVFGKYKLNDIYKYKQFGDTFDKVGKVSGKVLREKFSFFGLTEDEMNRL